jgi:metal-responsive CopG/Arc/MetJ family transcriptional regulator
MQIKSFSIREDLWQELQRQAEREERSASAILRDLIRRYLQQQKKRRRS